MRHIISLEGIREEIILQSLFQEGDIPLKTPEETTTAIEKDVQDVREVRSVP